MFLFLYKSEGFLIFTNDDSGSTFLYGFLYKIVLVLNWVFFSYFTFFVTTFFFVYLFKSIRNNHLYVTG